MDNELSTFNQIIVLVNGKVVNNQILKKNLDNVVILSKNKYINTKLTQYIDHLRTIYFREPSEKAINYLESEVIKDLAPNNKINKVLNELNIVDKPKTIKPKETDLDKRFRANQEKLRQIKAKMNGIKPKPKYKAKTIKKHIINRKKLTYKDIKPYLTKRQLQLVSNTATKRNVEYKTYLLTLDDVYFNKELEKAKFDSTKRFLGNKHIETKIGTVYRIFKEK